MKLGNLISSTCQTFLAPLSKLHPMLLPVLVGFVIPPAILLVMLPEADVSHTPNTSLAAAKTADGQRASATPPTTRPTHHGPVVPGMTVWDVDLAAMARSIAETAVHSVFSTAPDPTEKSRQEQWKRWLDPLRVVHRQRQADAAQRLEQINVQALTIVANADFDGFIEAATGLESKGRYVADQYAWRAWIKNLYCKYLFPRKELGDLVTGHLQSLAPTQAALSQQALVELGVDCELPAPPSHTIHLDASSMEGALNHAVSEILPNLEVLMVQHVATFIAGEAVAQESYEVTRSFMEDEYGRVSILGEVAAMLASVGGDLLVTTAVEELSPTTDNLRHSLRQVTDELVESCLLSGPTGQRLVSDVVDAIGQYDVALVTALIDHLGVDHDWAVDAFLMHVVDRSAE